MTSFEHYLTPSGVDAESNSERETVGQTASALAKAKGDIKESNLQVITAITESKGKRVEDTVHSLAEAKDAAFQ